MTIRVAINGFGRIGRSVLRAWAGAPSAWPEVEIVAINDIAPLDTCAYLFEYDSVFGPWRGSVASRGDALIVDGHVLRFSTERDPSRIDLSGIDVLMECTGRATDRSFAEAGLAAGAGRVLVSGPSPKADLTVVLGANDDRLASEHRIVSNASCTTNAIAPLVRLIDEEWGLDSALMTTVHCYTGSQPTVDTPMATPARSRAAALSMVPTTTSAEKLVDVVLPHLAGRVTGSAVRVPSASVSCVDLAVMTRDRPAVEAARAHLAQRAGPVIGWTDKPLVSSDLRARPESLIIAGPEIKRSKGGMLRVFGWYDNEWGFSCRMLDVATRMGRQMTEEGTT
ncbi:NAD-dependent glyceraldehyde-3-phosphate dehydrogenase [Roseibacterium elongatum DSM 19469]|uniref:NAD-dependent glyceraldehyde-3-phosphate dehydrogenase n=1 Tax=Roseicyclus elongatus DSM 19469 TaxID=1294273 RepID=W8SKI7_9RHOB|nr:glyceraldehyde 3-phosphate dehydrogenase NAD-binding domain-containing protein [Roseibacterium elongatum]AHM03025.1 NAD-dependent glyceraldehyde-3-phosphate dehydrogenase [Roseibacterium elongatum DSM 19469]